MFVDKDTIIAFPIERYEVEGKRYNRVLQLAKTLEKLPHHGYKNAYVTFSGYGEMVEEIFEIQDIRDYVGGLFQKCPHFIYFLETDFGQSRQNFTSTYADITMLYMGERKSISEWVSLGYLDPTQLPKMPVDLRIPDSRFKLLEKGLKNFGVKTKDFIGIKEVITYLKRFHNADV